MTDEIRRALEARLAALEGSPERRARIRARIDATESKEEPVMKRKFSMALAVVLALMLLGGTALAAGLGLNLFELVGNDMLRNIADRAVLETQAPVTVKHDELGEVEALIANAYYDGTTLEVAYTLKNWQRMEPWTPTEEEKAALEPYDDAVWMQHLMHVGGMEPAADGAPYGAIQYQVAASDHLTANGIEVPPWEAGGGMEADGRFIEYIEYEVPLPEGVADQEELALRIPLNQYITYFWFDGSSWYTRSEGQNGVSAMTATVKRDASAQVQRYTGTGEVNGVPVTVTADISIARGDVSVVAEGAFPTAGTNCWTMDLMDEQGRYLREEQNADPEDGKTLRFTCHGTGALPESLTMLLYQMDWDDPASEDANRAAGTTFTLTRE